MRILSGILLVGLGSCRAPLRAERGPDRLNQPLTTLPPAPGRCYRRPRNGTAMAPSVLARSSAAVWVRARGRDARWCRNALQNVYSGLTNK